MKYVLKLIVLHLFYGVVMFGDLFVTIWTFRTQRITRSYAEYKHYRKNIYRNMIGKRHPMSF